jgi:hypothetical protein
MMMVTAYHNIARDSAGRPLGLLDGYQAKHPLTAVFATELHTQDHETACAEVFRLLNIGDDPTISAPDPRAVRYRERHNRSLSVGDVVAVDNVTFYACTSAGWRRLDRVPTVVSRPDAPGTGHLADNVETLPEFLAVYGVPGRPYPVVEAGPGQWPCLVVKAGDKVAVVQVMNVGTDGDRQHLCLDVHAFVAGRWARASVFGMENGRRLHAFRATDVLGTSQGWPAARLVAVLVGAQDDATTNGGEQS